MTTYDIKESWKLSEACWMSFFALFGLLLHRFLPLGLDQIRLNTHFVIWCSAAEPIAL